ncbi:flagellar protein FlgN [Fredinandcohnia sp. QZ13]|uniref:flagellar protein FlgN n=1 Tax=Fredinandcohnia sp. QZ13 TaxID=3073144 RepID=UPI0028533DB3|nr:flagellar protein FlgN [Fredinandcohnia sp. QZ13]MDR4890000.1 flagellar protein FlgN [Fredinandcohnia sp. QZ13]
MSTEILINLLEKILLLHKKLYTLSEQKSEILKKDDIEALSAHMKDEQQYILAIKQLENERIAVVKKLFGDQYIDENAYTLSNVIDHSEEPNKSILSKLQKEITNTVSELRERNHLNQQLTNQSLQFVNMTLDMIYPTERNVNYGNPLSNQSKKEHRSMFDSKA